MLITLWFAIIACIAVMLCRKHKVRAMAKILWRSRKVRLATAFAVAAIAAIVLAFVLHPSLSSATQSDARKSFEAYSQTIVRGMEAKGAIAIDSACSLDKPMPELAYTMPAIIDVYNTNVNKPTTAQLLRLDDTLLVAFNGYKQFKNRTIKITKGVLKRIGPRYSISMESIGESHRLMVTYKGKPWDNEHLCSLPVMEASIRSRVDPAVLMSIVRHISDFDFNFANSKQERGLMAMGSIDGLDQIFVGAERLRTALDTSASMEDAVAAFYPIKETRSINSEWRKSPLKNSWVKEVLNDVQFYRNSGLKPATTP